MNVDLTEPQIERLDTLADVRLAEINEIFKKTANGNKLETETLFSPESEPDAEKRELIKEFFSLEEIRNQLANCPEMLAARRA